ncbi:MAG: HAD-IB family hydrolase [Magnetococcus sp. DMHC-6]
MSLALFDLDETLLNGDSDYLWGRFLVEQGIVESNHYETENRRFYEDYRQGVLDIHAYLHFQLGFLAGQDPKTLSQWHSRFMKEKIRPIFLPKGIQLIEKHRHQGDITLIITATNRFVTAPIAQELGVDHLLATDLERNAEGLYTGRAEGVPCFREGKVLCLQNWLQKTGHSLKNSWFYSDSINDLPLLEMVENPVAVDPDARLRDMAQQNNWPVISLREIHPVI